jgi:hypothetical protein
LPDGTQASYLDTVSDEGRSETRQVEPFDSAPEFGIRRFRVSLNNVSEIRPPGL